MPKRNFAAKSARSQRVTRIRAVEKPESEQVPATTEDNFLKNSPRRKTIAVKSAAHHAKRKRPAQSALVCENPEKSQKLQRLPPSRHHQRVADISSGLETFAIELENSLDDEPLPSFRYITESVLRRSDYTEIQRHMQSFTSRPCRCEVPESDTLKGLGQCLDHNRCNDALVECACADHYEYIGVRKSLESVSKRTLRRRGKEVNADLRADPEETTHDFEDKLVLQGCELGKETIWECGLLCTCDPDLCQNRLVQSSNGKMMVKLKVKKTADKGYGVFSLHRITKGTYIGHYSGEAMLYSPLATEDIEIDDYIHQTSSKFNKHTKSLIIDAYTAGNASRFINHDCEKFNIQQIYVMHDTAKVPIIGLFATRNIEAGEQVFLDYGESYWRIMNIRGKFCWCNTKSCKYQKMIDLTED